MSQYRNKIYNQGVSHRAMKTKGKAFLWPISQLKEGSVKKQFFGPLPLQICRNDKKIVQNYDIFSMQCQLCQVARSDKIKKKILSLKISLLKTKSLKWERIKYTFFSFVTNPRALEWRYMLIRELHMEVWLSRCFEWKSNCPSRSVQLQMSLEAKAPYLE